MLFNKDNIFDLIYLIPAVIIALTIHEFSHGFAAYLMGDTTAKAQGRLSLNPLRHLDIFGALMLLVVGFGWAKPVGVNPMRFKNPKVGMALTALAGPLSNFILAFICSIIKYAIMLAAYRNTGSVDSVIYGAKFLQYCLSINIGLGVFNLIPFPPLDGSRIFSLFLPNHLYFRFMQLERYTQFLLVILLFTGVLSIPLSFLRTSFYNGIDGLAMAIMSQL